MEPLQPGDPREIGPFRLVYRLGSGGFGTVFLGFRPGFATPAAVKVLQGPFLADPHWRQRFEHEVRNIRRVDGAVTAELVDAETEADQPWLATRFIAAPTLLELTAKELFRGPASWWLLSSLAEALLHIHAAPLIHRDLKPQNVLIGADGVKVIDFGISRAVDRPGVTVGGMANVGTKNFMSWEQFASLSDATVKSDVYALAATVVYAVSGHPPYTQATFDAWANGLPPNLAGVSGDMRELLAACLAKEPADRPSMSEVAEEATSRLLDDGIAPLLDSTPPLCPSHLDVIAASARKAASILVDALATDGTVPTGPPKPSQARELAGVGGSSGSGSSGDSGRAGSLHGEWADRWNSGLDERRNRYDG